MSTQNLKTKRNYKRHEIWNNFHENSDKTKVVCNLCNQEYKLNSCSAITNMKRHYQNFHNKEYLEILQIHLTKNNELNSNQQIITLTKNSNDIIKQNSLIEKNNIVDNNIKQNSKRKYKIICDDKEFIIETKKLVIEKIETIISE
jgi:hypothetical protein